MKTIIAGSPRSGTTLAMRILCEGLTSQEEHHGSEVNEPEQMTQSIKEGEIEQAITHLKSSLTNRFSLVKSPHVALLFPYIEPNYQVIITFRDLRLIVPSMFAHKGIIRNGLTTEMFWKKYFNKQMPEDLVERAISYAQGMYLSAIKYQGPIEVWNYGHWKEWKVNNQNIESLYERKRETSQRVMQDVHEGKVFSDNSNKLDIWDEFVKEYNISKELQQEILDANQRIKEAYAKKGLVIKTL